MTRERSRSLAREAEGLLVGGVNSPVRAFRAVGGSPLFIERGEGAYLVDADGNRYVDFVLSWGPLVLGHAHPEVVRAVQTAAERGASFGAPCESELELARRIRKAMPTMELIRMVNSGTEAVMSAVRVARAFTERDLIVKFAGCYHGHADPFLVQAGSGAATLSIPDSAGVPEHAVEDTLVARYNDLDSVAAVFDLLGDEIAAVVVEPVAGNMGLVLPEPGFLARLRELTQRYDALLLFDEVMTGFRVGPGGAQGHFDLEPDLTTLGKVIGGGLPVGAFGGRGEIMERLAPAGPVYQAGTLSGNPLAMAAGCATLEALEEPGIWEQLRDCAEGVAEGLRAAARAHGVPLQAASIGSMFGFFFSEERVLDWEGAAASDRERFGRFFHRMLDAGIYLAPSPFEAGFVSSAHGPAEVEALTEAALAALAEEAAARPGD